MTYKSMAKTILMDIGGCENVSSLDYCSTRLRFGVKDDSQTDMVHLKYEKGIIGAYKSGKTYQVVTKKSAPRVYKALKKIGAEQRKDKQNSTGK